MHVARPIKHGAKLHDGTREIITPVQAISLEILPFAPVPLCAFVLASRCRRSEIAHVLNLAALVLEQK